MKNKKNKKISQEKKVDKWVNKLFNLLKLAEKDDASHNHCMLLLNKKPSWMNKELYEDIKKYIYIPVLPSKLKKVEKLVDSIFKLDEEEIKVFSLDLCHNYQIRQKIECWSNFVDYEKLSEYIIKVQNTQKDKLDEEKETKKENPFMKKWLKEQNEK